MLWYVLQTQPLKERTAQQALLAAGFHAVVPTFKKRVRHRSGGRTVHVPLAPGYLFARFDTEPCWYNLLQIDSTGLNLANHSGARVLKGVLGRDGVPYALNPHEVEDFLHRGRSFDPDRAGRIPSVGDKIKIISGPLEGQVVDIRANKGRFAVIESSFPGRVLVSKSQAELVG